jgi:nucleoside-diphosphate kinase
LPEAEAGTIRGDFGSSRSFNLVHGSDSPAAASREIGLFFPEGVVEWDYQSEWIYDSEDLGK